MSIANPLWGAPRIHGELLKLGIDVGQTSVAKYMVKRREHRRRLGRAERFAWARARLRHMATRTGVIILGTFKFRDGR